MTIVHQARPALRRLFSATSLAVVRRSSLALRFDTVLFAGSLFLFVVTRFVGIDRFPIYFFTDEAVQAVRAASLVDNGFHDHGRLLPTYFQNGTYWNLSLSVYAQIIPHELFGYSIVATRGTSALFALTGAAATGLILRDIFRVRSWWLAPMFLVITPAFFLHSRTAFETVIGTSLYAWFLYFYLRYRVGRGWNLWPALVFAALTFYSYASIQVVVVLTAASLFFSDLPHHIRSWRVVLPGLVLLAVLIMPYARFRLEQGHEVGNQLRTLDSYWVRPGLDFNDRARMLWSEYREGLSPSYWFGAKSSPDLDRHIMKGYGRISIFVAPFIALGIALCLGRIRDSASRALLIALVLAPAGGAIVAIAVTRVLVLVVPAALLAGVGAAWLLEQLSRFVPYRVGAGAAFVLLAAASVFMLNDALTNGPTWYTNYGLYGMQYGARQLKPAVEEVLAENPDARVLVSPSWTNGADVVMQFLFPDETRVRTASIDGPRNDFQPIAAGTLFVMTPEEYAAASKDPKFKPIDVLREIPYPNGRPGFYIASVSYVEDAEEIFAAEREARRQPLTATLTINRQNALVSYLTLDGGRINNIFDGDLFTLARSREANPQVIDVVFESPRTISSVFVATGVMHMSMKVEVYAEGSEAPETLSHEEARSNAEPRVELRLATPTLVRRVRASVADVDYPPDHAHIHIREIQFR